MELALVQSRGCAVDLPGTGLGISHRSYAHILSVNFSLRSHDVGQLAGSRRFSTTSPKVLKLEKPGLRLSRFRFKQLKLQSARKIANWRAEGLKISPYVSSLWDGVKNPILQTIQDRGIFTPKQPQVVKNDTEAEAETRVFFSEDQTFNGKFPKGDLSTAAIDCIEQFSRLNGLTGKRMRINFESSAPLAIQNEARNFVEFTCFRYLARCNVDLHPLLKDAAFRRLTFSAMLAWQRPYKDDIPQDGSTVTHGLPGLGLVGEAAFSRIAPAITGVADHATAHFLFCALVGKSEGLSFDTWDRYCSELWKVPKIRKEILDNEAVQLGLQQRESIICVGSDTRQPVQKWNKNAAWPGRLTLTERALYFEANGLTHHQKATKLDLTGPGLEVERKKVGPFGLVVFDSAISISSGPGSEPWILEFVDFRGEGRRDFWLAIIKEISAMYAFIAEFGVDKNDPLVSYIYGAKNGRQKVINIAMMGIARLQAVQTVLGGKVPLHPGRLLQFSYIASAPSGELIRQALAVAFWGGRMEVKSRDIEFLAMGGGDLGGEETAGLGSNFVGTDGTVYLRNWAKSPSWSGGKSTAFWKARPGFKGLVLGKNHVVGGSTHVERAVRACRDQTRLAEKTQATIDAALLTGIPNNVDLLQKLLLPFSIVAVNLLKLKKWENPGASAAFLVVVYGIIYMDWLRFVLPSLLLLGATGIMTLRILESHSRLGDDFGKVTIREQPPTNTIQKILALKEALSALEDFLQHCNIALLKLRTVALSREPRVTNEVLIALVGLGVALIIVPFRYLLAIFLAEQFTNELKFREKSVQEFFMHLREWWSTIPAARVVVLPPEKQEGEDIKTYDEGSPSKGEAVMQAMSEWLGDESQISQLTGGMN